MFVERRQHGLHCLRDRIGFGEAVALEQRIKDRPGDKVLRQHLDGFGLGNAVVQVIPDFAKERLERGTLGSFRLYDEGGDTGDMRLGDFGDIGRPINNHVARIF